ncbi:hypothetical protein TRFO_37464 [Tritrichomonas foetus]|uniref:Uncharacterized protein n=1 Tax=Tritrichomonas foetus TaxID=1144522 RepID=A0A1J4JFH3_9EUKA|nr:hypothetical protein TRFO_37464 [Tritrichomonas foetus]|eukprot:OHS96395.1 hypothetical protein TRFO_37464 [Tritrichomonas foetus]
MFLKYVPNNPIEKEIGFNEESFEKEHEQRIKEAEERLLMEQMEEMKKQEKTKLLYSISKQKRDEKKIEMINIGLACHQEWAMIRCQSPTTRNKKFDKRPITATTKEALKELDEFDKKLREKEKNVVFLDVT